MSGTEVFCLHCGWSGGFVDLINDGDPDNWTEDSHMNACPSCYGSTVDEHDLADDVDERSD